MACSFPIIPNACFAATAVRLTLFWLALGGLSSHTVPHAVAGLLDDIGYSDLANEFGALTPTGFGISVSQGEANDNDENHRPNQNDSRFTGKSFTFKSGGSTTPSGHATTVGSYFYGNNLMGKGIADIHSWQADNWMGSGFLKDNTTLEPITESQRIQNHSWISTDSDAGVLRRLDYVVNRDNVLVFVGQNNGNSTTLPKLLGQSYNALSVGRSDGNHSHGFTTDDGAGRIKPEIVAPNTATSWATPTVGSAAAMLLETAIVEGYADAEENETVRALLMAGATKLEFLDVWDRTTTRPLDNHYGAGELNIFRSHRILTSGQQPASDTADAAVQGWDFRTTASNSRYFFEVPVGHVLAELSAVLVWNRIVTDGDADPNDFSPSPNTLDNLNLKLHSANGFTLDTELDASLSTVDNVEHIYLNSLGIGNTLGEGRYALEVISPATGVDYSLAWFGRLSEPHTWSSTDPVAAWDLGTNWTTPGIPDGDWIVEVDNTNVVGGQRVVLSSAASVYQATLSGTAGSLTIDIPSGVTLDVEAQLAIGSNAIITGGGTIDGFLANEGIHSIGQVETLTVTEDVDLIGVDLGVEDTYVQVRGTTTGTFSMLTANHISGTFATPATSGAASHLGHGRFLQDVNYSNSNVAADFVDVDILAAIEGDTDGDADVDLTDFDVLADNFDPNGIQPGNDWTLGDYNGDTRIDITDFVLLSNHFVPEGYPITNLLGDALLATVPEPSSWQLVGLGLLAVTMWFWCTRV